MNKMLCAYVVAGPNVTPQNNNRSLSPIFHGPVTLRYIFKNMGCMAILLLAMGSRWGFYAIYEHDAFGLCVSRTHKLRKAFS